MNERNQRRLFWFAMLIIVLSALKFMGQLG
jgi:hypothetical protein